MPRSAASPFTATGALPEGEAKAKAVRSMFDAVAPRYDLLNRLLTFRLDVRWRRTAVGSLCLPAGSTVLDVACGTGDLCNELAAQGYAPVGADVSFGMLAAARTTAPLVHCDGLALPLPDASVAGVTCGFALRNVTDLPALLAEMARVVRPGGRIALLDVAEPENAVLRAGHGVWFGKVVPFVGGLLSDRDAYRYLPRSLAYLPPPAELVALVAAAGFPDATRRLLPPGAAQLLVGTRR